MVLLISLCVLQWRHHTSVLIKNPGPGFLVQNFIMNRAFDTQTACISHMLAKSGSGAWAEPIFGANTKPDCAL